MNHPAPAATTPRNTVSRQLVLLALVFLGLLLCGWAEAATYAYRSTAYSWDTPSTSAKTVSWDSTCTSFPNGDDDKAVVSFTSGFTFTFAGTSYSSIRILSNGSVQFGTDTGFHREYQDSALPVSNLLIGVPAGCAAAAPTNVMMVYWLDINVIASAGASVKYELLGNAPNRRFVITWNKVCLYASNGVCSTVYSFQLRLNEDGTFVYQYGPGASDGTGASVGVQISTSDYTQFSFNQPFIDPTNGTAILWYQGNVAPAELAEYRMDEASWSGTAGEVFDYSGNGRHGQRVGSAQTVPNGKVCRMADIPNNNSLTTVDALDTKVNPRSDIGSAGSIVFWYRSTTAWNASGSNRQLFDATTTNGRVFLLTKNNNGNLSFALTDSNGSTFNSTTNTAYSFAANTWVHIGVSWNLQSGNNQSVLQIFVNGSLVDLKRGTTTGTLHSSLGTLYLGDNRGTVIVSPGTGNSAYGQIDEVHMYGFDLSAPQVTSDMYLTRSSCVLLHHFSISNSGSGSTCQAEPVTIAAHDIAHNPVPLSGTTMTLSTSTGHGDWSRVSGTGTLLNLGNGAATYIFNNESQVVLGLQDSTAETVTAHVNSGGVTETENRSLVFATDALKFVTANLVPASITPKVACKASDTGAEAQMLYLQAVKADLSGAACTSQLTSGLSISVDLALQCVNPATCSAGQTATVTNSLGIATSIPLAPASPAVPASFTKVPLVLGVSGLAGLSFNYSDVGLVRLHARYYLPLANGTLSTSYLSGTSPDIVIKPATFSLSNPLQAASPFTANPGAANASGAAFIKAGQPFSTTVTALNACGAATPAFGLETPAESVSLSMALVAPVGGSTGSLSSGSVGAFSGGAASVTGLSWSEVGIIQLLPGLKSGNYLGSGGAIAGSLSGNIGRFIPDHFALNSPSLVNRSDLSCAGSTFTYMGEPLRLGFTVTAQNAANGITSNYATANGFGKLDGSTQAAWLAGTGIGLAASDSVKGAVAASRLGVAPTGSFVAGIANYSATTILNRPQAPNYGPADGPYDNLSLSVRPTDSDGVTVSRTTVGSTQVRYGRLHPQNGFGSELLRLPIPLAAEYFDGSKFALNTADACTALTLTPGTSGGASTYTWGNLSLTKPSQSLTVSSVRPLGSSLNLSQGAGTLFLSAAGAGNVGSVDVGFTVPAWLQYDWRGTGVFTDNPVARAVFGIYKRNLIDVRENY